MATSAQNVIDSFESIMREKVALSTSLEQQWVLDSVAEYNLQIGTLNYNSTSFTFDEDLDQSVIMILGCLVKLRYLRMEVSRVNKINNIITKDLTLNGSGDSKRMTIEEAKMEIEQTEKLINMLKTPSYAN